MSYIKKEFIEKLEDVAKIEEVIGDFVALKRSGANFKGLSPFTDERSPSFVVSPVKNCWKDFSSGKGGNGAISFLIEKEKLEYPEAVKFVAQKYNMPVEYEPQVFSEKKRAELDKKEEQRKVLSAAYELYRKEFLNIEDKHPAHHEVYAHRDYDREVVIEWGIGYAPSNFLYDKLKNSGRVTEGEALGLIKEQWDKYSDRVIYPIHDINGLLIGLAGRTLGDPKKKGKWFNPTVDPANLLYNKSRTLYGLHKAKRAIRIKGEAYMVEGYNDVIGFHRYGAENTVAGCGTAITVDQLRLLRKFCERLVLVLDPDKAGYEAVLKTIPTAIEQGFRVEVVSLDLDPDDFTRRYGEIFNLCGGLESLLSQDDLRRDGFGLLIAEHIQGNEVSKGVGARKLCEIIAKIKDTAVKEIYLKWVQRESKVGIKTLNSWVKENEIKEIEVFDYSFLEYELPDGIDTPLDQLKPDIVQYGMFMAKDQIWMEISDRSDKTVRFSSVSNFSIEILQHMQDEKIPMKLVRIKNIFGAQKIFDVPSNAFNTPQAFVDMVTGFGNYQFRGGRKELNVLTPFLFDKMGDGKKIDVLGWQPDGKFWAWNNKIVLENGEELELDDDGCIEIAGTHYYIPSANSIYSNNPYKFEGQKRFRVIENSISFDVFMMQIYKVHRDHAISGLLFAATCLFRDIIVAKLNRFPILFLYGPGGTGKDELAEIVQGFTGIPQTAINLEGNLSTGKASIRELAQFRNGISQMSEYKRGNRDHDGMLKQIYDLRGYKRGNLDSYIGTDSIPVESGLIVTGNDFPDAEALIQRYVWNEMTKNVFTQQELEDFDLSKDMMAGGMSGYANMIIKQRKIFEERFEKEQRSWKGILKERFPEAKERMVANYSILSAVYAILRDHFTGVKWPFSQNDMIDHWGKAIDQQLRKINAASLLVKFWECFVSSLRGNPEDRIQVHRIVSIEGDKLFIQWTHAFAKIQKQWWILYHELPPSKATILEQIEKDPGLLHGKIASHSFDTGRDAVRSSAICLNLSAMSENLKNDIVGSIMFQINEGTLPFPDKDNDKKDDENDLFS